MASLLCRLSDGDKEGAAVVEKYRALQVEEQGLLIEGAREFFKREIMNDMVIKKVVSANG